MADVAHQPKKVCSAMCGERAKYKCIRCGDATPPSYYCSKKCQIFDWKFHKMYCGKYAYTFDLTLMGSSNPVIKRTFDVPSWFTFPMLHYTIQYGMGPWQCTHLHQFIFEKPLHPSRGINHNRNLLEPRGEQVLSVLSQDLIDDMEDQYNNPYLPPPARMRVRTELEDNLKLSEVFEDNGRLHDLVVAPEGEFYPLIYTYDFGDNWEHKLVYKGKKLARAARPLFSKAKGCGPVEDCHGPSGWNSIKAAYRLPPSQRTVEQNNLIRWARDASGLESAFDPFKEPNVTQMNYEGRWENHLQAFMGLSDKEFSRMFYGADFEEEELSEYSV